MRYKCLSCKATCPALQLRAGAFATKGRACSCGQGRRFVQIITLPAWIPLHTCRLGGCCNDLVTSVLQYNSYAAGVIAGRLGALLCVSDKQETYYLPQHTGDSGAHSMPERALLL